MAIKNNAALVKGLALGISFLVVLVLLFMPIFGDGYNGLEYSDNMFNKLSKGSSYFIPAVQKSAAKFAGQEASFSLKMGKPEDSTIAQKILTSAGAQVKESDGSLKVNGDLGKIFAAALDDSDAGYKNDAAVFSMRYGLDAQVVLNVWWNIMKGMDKGLKKDKKLKEAGMAVSIQKKGIEAAHNYFGIEAIKVADRAGIMSGLLSFYVLYTVWWGFAIFYLFEAFGFVMKKGKAKKKEV